VYESFFKLNARPFADGRSNIVVPKSSVASGLDELRDWLHRDAPFALVTGPSGCGKSHLCRMLVRESRSAVLLASAFTSTGALWQAALFELDENFAGLNENEAKLQLLKAANERNGLLIVLDEAHGLAESTLEEVRTLTDYRAESRLLVRILLSGQVELEERLACPELEALNQRIGCHVVLEPLTQDQSVDYLELRLSEVGRHLEDVFSADAVRLICHASEGNLRCLNQLSDQSLVLAFAANERLVSAGTVRTALEAAKELPLRWNPISLDEDVDDSVDPIVAPVAAQTKGDVDEALADDSEFDVGAYAVIEVGGEEPEPAAEAPSTQSEDVSVPAILNDSQISSASAASETPSHKATDDVIELPLDDPYARLDRVCELGGKSDVVQPLPIQDAAIEVSRPEEEILSRLYELRHELQSAVRNSPHIVTPEATDGNSRFTNVPAEKWDVIEPAVDEVHSTAPSLPDDDPIGEVAEAVAVTPPAAPPRVNSGAPSPAGYGRLFSRLKRQRMKMAAALSSERSDQG